MGTNWNTDGSVQTPGSTSVQSGNGALAKVAQQSFGVFSLEIFKVCQDVGLGNVSRGWTKWTQRSLSTSAGLLFYDIRHYL